MQFGNEIMMATESHVGHVELVQLAEDRVNLKRDDAKEEREQIEAYVFGHPDYSLVNSFSKTSSGRSPRYALS